MLWVVVVRLGIILPAIAIRAPGASFRAAWADVRRVYMRVFIAFVGVSMPFWALYALIDRFGLPMDDDLQPLFLVDVGLFNVVLVFHATVLASLMSHVFLECAKRLSQTAAATNINTST